VDHIEILQVKNENNIYQQTKSNATRPP